MLFFINQIMAQGTRIAIKLTTGTKDLLPKSSVYFKLNYKDGRASEEYTIYQYGGFTNGFAPNTVYNASIDLTTHITDAELSGFTIRHQSAIGNKAEPYDNWDLKGLNIDLIDRYPPRVWTISIYNSPASFVYHFTQYNKVFSVKF